MAAGIAHEINNPLSGILLFTTSVRKEIKEDGPVKQCLDIVIRETIRCRGIIQNLLEFAREKQPQRAPTNINSVLERTLGLLENLFLVNGVKLRKNLQPELPDCYVDGNQIQQTFLNLLLNAVEAIGQNGMITVRTRFTLTWCRLGTRANSRLFASPAASSSAMISRKNGTSAASHSPPTRSMNAFLIRSPGRVRGVVVQEDLDRAGPRFHQAAHAPLGKEVGHPAVVLRVVPRLFVGQEDAASLLPAPSPREARTRGPAGLRWRVSSARSSRPS